jgi:hypothetical protein
MLAAQVVPKHCQKYKKRSEELQQIEKTIKLLLETTGRDKNAEKQKQIRSAASIKTENWFRNPLV